MRKEIKYNKVAIITGEAVGMGRFYAEKLLEEARVVITDFDAEAGFKVNVEFEIQKEMMISLMYVVRKYVDLR